MLSRHIPDLVNALGGEGRTDLGIGFSAFMQNAAAAIDTSLMRLTEGHGHGAVTGAAVVPEDIEPDQYSCSD